MPKHPKPESNGWTIEFLDPSGAVGIALDSAAPGQLAEAVAAAGTLPVLRPLWRRQRNTRGEIDEVFDGYGLLSGPDIVKLADGELAVT